MAQQSVRSQTTGAIFFIVAIILVVSIGLLFFLPGSPFRPEASETTSDGGVAQATFRDGTVTRVSNGTVAVDEPNGGSFSFPFADYMIVRALNADGRFEITDRSRLGSGDIVSVYYQSAEGGLVPSHVDILQEN